MDSKEFKPRTILRVPNQPGGSSNLRGILTLPVTVPDFSSLLRTSVIETDAHLLKGYQRDAPNAFAKAMREA